MKKLLVLVLFLASLFAVSPALAQSGCCSWHGGVSGCSSGGRQICNDGTLSPSCTCYSQSPNYGSSSSLGSSICKSMVSDSYKELQTKFDENVDALKNRDEEIKKLNDTISSFGSFTLWDHIKFWWAMRNPD